MRGRIAPPPAASPSRTGRAWVAAWGGGVRTGWGCAGQGSDPRNHPNFPNLPLGCRGEQVLRPQFHDGQEGGSSCEVSAVHSPVKHLCSTEIFFFKIMIFLKMYNNTDEMCNTRCVLS